jgi:hypothetical protein
MKEVKMGCTCSSVVSDKKYIQNFMREPFETQPLGRPRSKLEFNNEVDLKEVVRI